MPRPSDPQQIDADVLRTLRRVGSRGMSLQHLPGRIGVGGRLARQSLERLADRRLVERIHEARCGARKATVVRITDAGKAVADAAAESALSLESSVSSEAA